MSGISSTLSIAKTAIAAQQYGLNITGQNIANVNNSNYSVQNADQKSLRPALYGGFLFGTGVDTDQIRQSVNQLIEDRLTNEMSTQASFEEQESYMRVLESYFDESSEKSVTSSLAEFWASWHDLSDNPKGSAERVAVLENGKNLAHSFESIMTSMDDLSEDLTSDINAAVVQVNTLISQIAVLNKEITSVEIGRTANDLRDQRNRLQDELGQLISIKAFEQSNGSLTINVAGGFTILDGPDTHELVHIDKKVQWISTSGARVDISADISSGRIAGFLEMRDVLIPKYRAEVNELSREMIWAVNYQHSQGTGLSYFSEPVTGDYATDDTGWFSSFEFGDKLDLSKDFIMWMEDKTRAETEYTRISMDMDISQARISDWQGSTPGSVQSIYQLTVLDEGDLGDKVVTETDGDGLARVHGSASTVSTALDAAIAGQTLKVYDGPSGTGIITVADVGGDAKRSAASIAKALNGVDGVTAHASKTKAAFDPSGILNAEDGDEVKFSLYVDGVIQAQTFIRDSEKGTLQAQFEDALLSAAQAVNIIYEDTDLFVEGLSITSASGRTLGIQDFEVQDNAGVLLGDFLNFDGGDTITFTVDAMAGTAAVNTTLVTVDLTGVDTLDPNQISLAFSDALSSALAGKPFSVENDPSTQTVILRTTDGTDIRLRDAGNDIGDDASLTITPLGVTTSDGANIDDILSFTALADDSARFNAATTANDSLIFSGNGTQVTVNESSAGAGNKAGVITGTVTALLDTKMSIYSTVSGIGAGGLYTGQLAQKGSSILTLGGEGGFSGFTNSTAANETISFDLDGTAIDFTTTSAGGTSDLLLAMELEKELKADLMAAGKDTDYQIIRTGSSVSIIKNTSLDDPIRIENFSDSWNSNAAIQVRTGTGEGSHQPENDLVMAGNPYKDSSTSSLYDNPGIILWERLDKDGIRTGASGLLTVEDQGRVAIVENGLETLSFEISKGSLVAGNTLTVNTDTSGKPDPLDFSITGRANSINDIYQFRIVSGGKVGHLPVTGEEPLVIAWTSSVSSGEFIIEGHDPPYTPGAPVEVKVDGMNLKFYDGTLLTGDVFTVTTGNTGISVFSDPTGRPTGETLSDWHWTLDSFAAQFNRQAQGLKASATPDNRLTFEASDSYYALENMEYSETNGFSEANCSIQVKDWSAMNFASADLRFVRSQGSWGVVNDPTGGSLRILPEGGDDDGFGVDFNGDGLADIEISFTKRVSGDGFVEFDCRKKNANDIGFAFSDDTGPSSGLAAVAGINTFFNGYNALTMAVDETLEDTRFIASAVIDSQTGAISQGDNTNALAMADVQFEDMDLRIWTYTRSGEARSSKITASLDDYYNQLISSLGIDSRTIKNAKEFGDIMVNNIQEQRDSISAVSLDEEMIRLIKYQHAFSAASKLLSVSDEMLNTLISMR